jgi:thymidine kinase
MNLLGGGGGRIELIIGPMFASKTTELITRVRRAALADQAAIIIKYCGDRRYKDGATVATHADIQQESTKGSEAAAPVRVVTTNALSLVDVSEMIVGIDEGQFYPDLVACCERWAAEGRRVIVAALDGDFARRPFGQVCDLVPLCESVEKRRGVCMVCRGRDSAFTLRIGRSTALVEIGAQESYRTVCRQCYTFGPCLEAECGSAP